MDIETRNRFHKLEQNAYDKEIAIREMGKEIQELKKRVSVLELPIWKDVEDYQE